MVEASRWPNTSYTTWAEVVTWAPGLVCSAIPPATTVVYDGSCYKCKTSHTAGASFDATKWTLIARGVADTSPASAVYAKTAHGDSYDSISDAIADLENDFDLLLSGGETYPWSGGRFAAWPDRVRIRGEGAERAKIDFSGNASYFNDGLLKIHGSLDATTEQAITKTLGVSRQYVFTSITYAAGTCTATTVDDHPFSTGDEIFIYGSFGMSAADAAYMTMKDSDEGMSLSLPVTITKTGAKTFTYSPPNGGTPGASFGSPGSAYCRLNDLYVGAADVSDYARGDMVKIESSDTYKGYNGSVTLAEGENTEIEYVEGSGFWLTQPVKFNYTTSPKVTKVNAKTVALHNVEIIGTGGSSTNSAYGQADIAVDLKWTRNCIFDRVKITDCDYKGINEAQSLGNIYLDPEVYFDKFNAGGAASGIIEIQYGLCFSSGSRDAKIIRPKVYNGRHAVTEACVTSGGSGRVINLQIFDPEFHNQWSAAFASHDMYDHIGIYGGNVSGGQGFNFRDGNFTVERTRFKNSEYQIYAYGKIENVRVVGTKGEGISRSHIRLTPTNKEAASAYYQGALPNVKNVTVRDVSGSGGQFGLETTCNPNTTDNPVFSWDDFNFSNLNFRNLRYYPVYMPQGGGSNTYSYKNGAIRDVFGDDTNHLVYLDNPISISVEGARGLDLKSGSVGVKVIGSSAANNTFNQISGTISGGGTMTTLDVVATSTGNKTDSLDYESLTIASGAITAKFRNVPLKIVDTEGAAASDDLDTINGLLHGDTVIIRTNNSARDVVVKHGSGSNKTRPGFDVTLGTTADLLALVSNGSTLVPTGGPIILQGTATYDPASLSDGAGATTTVTVTGAALGDFARASFSLDLQGITLTAWVSAADTVSVRFQNESGGALDLASGTIRARVEKAS